MFWDQQNMSQPANAWGSNDVAAAKYSVRKADATCDSVVLLSVFCDLLLWWYPLLLEFIIVASRCSLDVLCCQLSVIGWISALPNNTSTTCSAAC